eukprot:scaffold251681_cov34-Prasinocladus_malaysianus.AAC.1
MVPLPHSCRIRLPVARTGTRVSGYLYLWAMSSTSTNTHNWSSKAASTSTCTLYNRVQTCSITEYRYRTVDRLDCLDPPSSYEKSPRPAQQAAVLRAKAKPDSSQGPKARPIRLHIDDMPVPWKLLHSCNSHAAIATI